MRCIGVIKFRAVRRILQRRVDETLLHADMNGSRAPVRVRCDLRLRCVRAIAKMRLPGERRDAGAVPNTDDNICTAGGPPTA